MRYRAQLSTHIHCTRRMCACVPTPNSSLRISCVCCLPLLKMFDVLLLAVLFFQIKFLVSRVLNPHCCLRCVSIRGIFILLFLVVRIIIIHLLCFVYIPITMRRANKGWRLSSLSLHERMNPFSKMKFFALLFIQVYPHTISKRKK